MAVLWLKTVLGAACDMSLFAAAPPSCEPLVPELLPAPCAEDAAPAPYSSCFWAGGDRAGLIACPYREAFALFL